MKHLSRFTFASMLAMIALLAGVGRAAAQQPTPSDNDVNQVASQIYCPLCQNVRLDVCPTAACAQMRELIREKLAAGWSTKQIEDYFVQQYGPAVLAEPPAEGWNLLVYIVPLVALVAGAFFVAQVFRHSPKTQSKPARPTLPSEDPYLNRLEDELQHRQH
ncbi:MAG TPA: cytochrome c-type biogenesis protein CcmH [Longilinea sp.]|nr:cytochrome c-type biogenesis protein CcmH [Longilinea sp.]